MINNQLLHLKCQNCLNSILILFGILQLPLFGVQKFLMSSSQYTQGHLKKDKGFIWNVLPLERKNSTQKTWVF